MLYKNSKIYDSKTGPVGVKPNQTGDRAMDRWLYEVGILQNPYTKKIPINIELNSALFSERIAMSKLTPEGLNTLAKDRIGKRRGWENRGPGNVGGRTRALALDLNDENIVFAGGVSGGLYRSTNLGQTWTKVTKRRQSPSITAIAQDPRPGYRHIWYYASGERFGNSASASGAFYQGSGIFKSINSGNSFRQLKNTNDGDVTSFSSFDLINSIAVHPHTGDVYVATFDGMFRSTNGGRSFDEVLPSAFDSATEVIITPSGRIYATVDIFGEANAGFYYSDNGTDFVNITPENIVPSFGRTKMAFDPSDENRVYFFSANLGDGIEAFLWRYQDDAETPEEQWVDLSLNLPVNIGGVAGDLDLQGTYNMVIEVHPTKPDIVFVGGTNLYRSTTGFTTPTGFESWIGGYTIFANSFALYPNHHPDQHNLVFLPSNPDRAISANDGGVQLTEDVTQADNPVAWISLNNNYITTQPYAISMDMGTESTDLLAGFQDNGSWFTDSESLLDPWISDFGGDGTYNAIADGGLTRYVSAQFGNTFRLNFDAEGNFVSFTRVTPAGASGFGFVAPFILDANNDNIMYYPAGNVMWRNDNLDNIPLFSNAPASEGWSRLDGSLVADGSTITALDISKFPLANTLYYGTANGQIFKMENANLDGQQAEDVSTGRGLPPGNVNNIYVDPKNPDRVFAVFSNYNIPSIFMTRNGGETWKDISGNLEENKDGTGNGPSVRWFSMLGNKDGYFAGTSTGLYFTKDLSGKKTDWKRISQVGNNVIPQIKTRKDGFVAAAAHGNGVYSANFRVTPLPEAKLSVANLIDDLTLPISFPDTVKINLNEVFTSTRRRAVINYEITNSNDALANVSRTDSILNVIINPGLVGTASIGIIARSGREKVSEGFRVNVIEPAIYEQNDPVVNSTPSQLFTDFGGLAQSADDFIVPEGSKWTINRVTASGGANNSPVFSSATVSIYTDANGVPGQEIYNSGEVVPLSDPADANLNIELPAELELSSGTYWLSVYTNLAFNPNATQWFWLKQATVIGNESTFRDNLNLFGSGAVDWTPQSIAFNENPEDLIFQVFGSVQDADEQIEEPEVAASGSSESSPETVANETLTTVSANMTMAVWPNPSSQYFEFAIKESSDAKVSAQIFNVAGQLIHQVLDHDASKNFVWDSSANPTGLYFVKVSGQNTNASFTLIKK
ncbi:T9SS type A sorting domain-containing protein [uncultured Croceitalea sp.]|uniref:T9SS type A sorting domain-containing protein n=1 Tax=uncultured Croceitalea sp. TaxID=1798908 RepID=UPI0033065132